MALGDGEEVVDGDYAVHGLGEEGEGLVPARPEHRHVVPGRRAGAAQRQDAGSVDNLTILCNLCGAFRLQIKMCGELNFPR